MLNEGKSEQIQKQLIRLSDTAITKAENAIQRKINERYGKAGGFFKVKVIADKDNSSKEDRASPHNSDFGKTLYKVELTPRNFKSNGKYGHFYKPYATYLIKSGESNGRFAIRTYVINGYSKTWEDVTDNDEGNAGYIKDQTNNNIKEYYHFIQKHKNEIKEIIEQISNSIVFGLANAAKQAKDLDKERSYRDERTSDIFGNDNEAHADVPFNSKKWPHVPNKLKKEIWEKIRFKIGQEVAKELNHKYWKNGMSDKEHKNLQAMITKEANKRATEIFEKEMDKKEKLALREKNTYFNY